MAIIRIAQAQINTTVGDFSGNLKKIIGIIEQARNQDTDIVLFPELSICGYPPEDLLLKRGFLQDNLKAIEDLKQHARDIIVIVGYADSSDSNVYNAAAIMQNQRLVESYHKVELPNYGVFDEKRYFQEGSGFFVFELNQVIFAMSICEDIWIEGGVVEQSAQNSDVDIILNISASPFHAGKVETRQKVVEHFARKTDATVCFNNLVGGQDELVFDGGSFIMTPQGSLISRAKRFREEFLITDVHIDREKDSREKAKINNPKIIFVSLDSYKRYHKNEFPGTVAGEYGRLEEIYHGLVLGTKDYVRKNGFKKVVIGLSGGIDSALTAAIAVGALGPENVVGVTMPSQYTSSETLSDAELLARNLGVQSYAVPIHGIYKAYLDSIKDVLDTKEHGITHENIQARVRGNILMALSNRFGWMVLTTGNKSETAVGYCTLYGDMAGGFAAIKDSPKTMVFELSEYIN